MTSYEEAARDGVVVRSPCGKLEVVVIYDSKLYSFNDAVKEAIDLLRGID